MWDIVISTKENERTTSASFTNKAEADRFVMNMVQAVNKEGLYSYAKLDHDSFIRNDDYVVMQIVDNKSAAKEKSGAKAKNTNSKLDIIT